MKYLLTCSTLFFIQSISALNVPFYLQTFSSHLPSFNPAFNGTSSIINGRVSRLAFGFQSIYSYQMEASEYDYNYPIFFTYKKEGFTNVRNSGFRRNAHQEVFHLNAFEIITKSLSMGLGLSYNNVQLDRYSNSSGLELGISLIHNNGRRSPLWSLGFNTKWDHYDFEFENLDDFTTQEKANVTNVDAGLAYLSKNRRLKVGMSCYNLLNRTVGKRDVSPMFEGPYSMMVLDYNRLFFINVNKTSVLGSSKQTSIDYAMLLKADWVYIDDIYLNFGVNRTFNKKNLIGVGFNMSKFITKVFTPTYGIYLKGNLGHFELMYNYSLSSGLGAVSSGVHYLGFRAWI